MELAEDIGDQDRILSDRSMDVIAWCMKILKIIMTRRPTAILAGLMVAAGAPRGTACCAVARGGSHVVNADQTVIMLWDEARQTQHFIRKAEYAYSPEVAAWAAPYLTGDWHFTALKVVKDVDARSGADLKAAALRISFRTDRPLFPYREPDAGASRSALDAPDRLLRIYFIADARFRGGIDGGRPWSGRPVWSGDITPHREELLRDLDLPEGTGPSRWWLTEFEDRWPYAKAAGDVYFSRDADQGTLDGRHRLTRASMDVVFLALLVGCCVRPLMRVWRALSPPPLPQ